jgi:hypothetical protein
MSLKGNHLRETAVLVVAEATPPSARWDSRDQAVNLMVMPQNRKLHVHEQVEFTKRFGTAQRFGWAFMALVMMAALGGLTGAGGPASRVEIGAADLPVVMRVGRQDYMKIYQDSSGVAKLGPLAGNWLEIGSGTSAGGQSVVLPVTARKSGLARLRIPTGPDEAVEVSVLILP